MKRLLALSSLFLVTTLVGPTLRAASAQMAALPIDGIGCQSMEGAAEHIHQHLQLFNRGRAVTVPAQIGIPAGGNCLYWLHTHTPDGIIHVESPKKQKFTLGQFFDIWGQELSWWQAGPVRAVRGQKLFISVNHHKWSGKDPRSIVLKDHEEIVIQSGPPWTSKYKDIDWSRM